MTTTYSATSQRKIAACHAAAAREARAWIDPNQDGEGAGRWTAAAQAARHLATLSPERRAQLNDEWEKTP